MRHILFIVSIFVLTSTSLTAQIPLQSNIKAAISAPLDWRDNIATLGDTTLLNLFGFKWKGMTTYVTDISQERQWNGFGWVIKSSGGAADQTLSIIGQELTISGAGGNTVTLPSSGSSEVTYNATLTAGLLTKIALYGFAPVYSTSAGVVTEASTTDNTTLHQYYVQGVSTNVIILGSGAKTITATFAYTVGDNYYLQDDGTLTITADNDGDAIDYDSQVCYVVASLGSNQYIINLTQPKHFVN